MKRINIILCVFIISLSALVRAQEPGLIKHFEFFANVNRSAFYNDNTDNGSGFGAGINVLFRPERSHTLLSGLEYNHTRHFQDVGDSGDFYQESDIRYSVHLLSIPFGFRYSFGDKHALYIESGIYADMAISSSKEGTNCSYAPDSTGQMTGECIPFLENGYAGPCLGIYTGLAYSFTFDSFTLAIRPDMKFGFRTMFDANNNGGYGRYFRLSVILGFR